MGQIDGSGKIDIQNFETIRVEGEVMEYRNLFSPITIGSMTLKNRISMPPMYTKYANADGSISERIKGYFSERAKNGVGFMLIENTCVDWEYGHSIGNPVAICNDRFGAGLNELVEEMHKYGAKIAPELHHTGRLQTWKNIGRQPIAPSSIELPGYDTPREMTAEEIELTIQKYVDAAILAQKVGFDAVWIHGAHGYLISQFVSPLTNLRKDQFGGSFENRIRFSLEIVRRVRAAVGIHFPVGFRFSADEWVPGGFCLEEGIQYAQALELAGVTVLDVSAGGVGSPSNSPMQGQPVNFVAYLAGKIKSSVQVPIFTAGSMGTNPQFAESLLAEGSADVIHFGRSLIADPELPRKLFENHPEEIRPCLRCNECQGIVLNHQGLQCAVNPCVGREYKEKILPVATKKKILVIGAGPCGMQYAITAAQRGHKVTVLEKNKFAGGLVYVAGVPVYKKKELWGLVKYYEKMALKLGITLVLNTEVETDIIEWYEPDQVVLATGAHPLKDKMPGAAEIENAYSVLLNGAVNVGKRVVIIGGSGVGTDLAMYLREKGKDVVILEMLDEVCRELNVLLRSYLLNLLKDNHVETYTNCQVIEISQGKILAQKDGQVITFECDTVISATGFEREDDSVLMSSITRRGIQVKRIGAEKGTGHIMTATRQGFLHAFMDD